MPGQVFFLENHKSKRRILHTTEYNEYDEYNEDTVLGNGNNGDVMRSQAKHEVSTRKVGISLRADRGVAYSILHQVRIP